MRMLITSPEFTGKTYYTKSFDPLDCSTKNVIYRIACTLCGKVGWSRQFCVSGQTSLSFENASAFIVWKEGPVWWYSILFFGKSELNDQ